MRKKAGPIIAGMLLVVVIALIFVIGRKIEAYLPSDETEDLHTYYGVTTQDDVAIIWNQELSSEKAKYIDGAVYLTLEQVKTMLSDRFYWDKNEKLLRYTSASESITAYAGKNDCYVGNDLQSWEMELVKLEGETVYIALDFVKNYADLHYELFTEPNRIVLTTDWSVLCGQTTIKKATELRVKGGIKSAILAELEKGTAVSVLETMDDWSKVSTADGMIGYVKNKKLRGGGKEDALSEPEFPAHSCEAEVFAHRLMEEPVKLLWHQTTNADTNARISMVLANAKGINVISPTWFYLNDNEGNLADRGNPEYVNYCHAQGIQVWGLFSNLENSDVDSTYVLTHTSVRENLVNQVIAKALSYNLDGVNVDFEALSSEVGDSYIQFIRELSLKCEANGLTLSVDNYVPSSYTQFYNRAEQANYADYVIVMAYDEHYAGSDAGSVASIGFVEDGAKNTLAEGVPAEQTVLAMPFYTRIWAETPKEDIGDSAEAAADDYVGYEVSSQAVGMTEARSRIEANGAGTTWLDECGQYYAEYENGGVTYKVWLEDAKSIEEKLKVWQKYKLAGGAFWKAGLETADVWETINSYIK